VAKISKRLETQFKLGKFIEFKL